MNSEDLVPVFTPPLVAILARAESQLKRALNEQEIIAIRDRCQCVMLPSDQAEALANDRGYQDLDPENVWEEWQQIRTQLV